MPLSLVPVLKSESMSKSKKGTHSEITTSEVVIYSEDANARNHRISENLLWLERRCARRAGQIQSSIHRKGHYPEFGVPLGNGDQERTTAFSLCGNQRANARRHQRRGSRAVLDR